MAATETSTRAAAALDDLYRHHVGDVYRYTYAVLGNHADAEDVTQTTFVNALRALERGDVPHNPSSWLIAIAQNVVRQRWRQAASRPTEVELVQDVPEAASEDDDIELDELVRALQRIPPAQREALVLRELEGRSYNEISALLGLSTSALETLLFRARRSLAEELENLVTCQSAELAMSKQLDGRLSRKERRRLDEHLAECPDCARLAETQKRQRRAFKGLAVLPLPIGLALFKGAPSAAAAVVPPHHRPGRQRFGSHRRRSIGSRPCRGRGRGLRCRRRGRRRVALRGRREGRGRHRRRDGRHRRRLQGRPGGARPVCAATCREDEARGGVERRGRVDERSGRQGTARASRGNAETQRYPRAGGGVRATGTGRNAGRQGAGDGVAAGRRNDAVAASTPPARQRPETAPIPPVRR